MTALLFTLVQSPLQAQSQAQVVVRFDHQPYAVSAQQINEQGNEPEQGVKVFGDDGSEQDSIHITKGMTLKDLLLTAQVPADVKTIELERNGGAGTLYASRDDTDIIFYSTPPDAIGWIRKSDSGDDPNAADQGTLAEGESKLNLKGRAGNILKVKVTTEPSEGIRSGTEVSFSASVKEGLDGENFDKYSWDFGDGDVASEKKPTHTYSNKKAKAFSVSLTVEGDKDSIGQDVVTLNVKRKATDSSGTGSGGTGSGGTGTGGTGTGGSGGTGSGGTGGGGIGGGGSFPTTPPSSIPSTPSPSLPAPETPPPSTPPSDSGQTPDNQGFDTTPSVQSGTEVTGILVSAPASASQSGQPGSKSTPAKQPDSNGGSESTDWKIPVGIVLAALLLILGALRERMSIKRLLPSAKETPDLSAQPT